MIKKYLPWALSLFVAIIFIQSLFFKFTGAEETVIIFNTIGNWMNGFSFLAPIADAFKQYGGYTIGTAELIAAILILIPATRFLGALLGLGIMTGAVFFHLFTPLGVNRIIDAAGNTDGGALFIMACAVWTCCAILLFLSRRR